MSQSWRSTVASLTLFALCAPNLAGAQVKPSYEQPISVSSLILHPVPASVPNTVIYDNVENFSGQGFTAGGTTAVGASNITNLAADDITVAAGMTGVPVDSVTFSTANFNAAAVTVSPILRFYDSDGSGSGPGTLIGGFNLNPITLTAGSVQLFTITGADLFTVPNSSYFWAGEAFSDNGGTTGATATQLNNVGQGLYNPPAVGSSQDAFFLSTSPSSFTTNSPAGQFEYFGGSPVANYGWEFETPTSTNAVPEADTAYLLLTGLGLLSTRFRHKRAE